jgi:hypothetical protein
MREAGRTATVVAMTIVVAAAAACGGASRLSKPAYEKKLKGEGAQLSADFSGLKLAGTTNLKGLASKLGTAQSKIEHAASDIGDLKPPKEAEADNQKIADSLHRLAKVFGQMKAAASKDDRMKLLSLVQTVQPVLREGSGAAQDLKAKGYDIGEFGR